MQYPLPLSLSLSIKKQKISMYLCSLLYTLTECTLTFGGISHKAVHGIDNSRFLTRPVHKNSLEKVLGEPGLASVDEQQP